MIPVRPLRLGLSVCIALNAPGAALAFGGSFEQSPAPQTQGPAGSPAEDDFGGSFGSDFGTQPATSSQTGTGMGGSFDDLEPAPPQPHSTTPAPLPQERPQVPAEIFEIEAADFGIPPAQNLRPSNMHAPTPLALPGGALVSTQGIIDALLDGMDLVMIDVLGADYTITGAYVEPGLAAPGHFNDATQQQAAIWLRTITDGNRDQPIVIFCSDPHCWLSYNAALRTIAAGYRAVYWYRGGLYTWQMVGLPMEPSPF